MMNVTIYDNENAFCVCVDGLIVRACNSLGGAWRHIEWMYQIAQQKFTVGKKQIPVTEWLEHMYAIGYLDKEGV